MGDFELKTLCRDAAAGLADEVGAVPLYERVRLQLRSMLLSHSKPGDLLPTQSEIASAMGTSMITVKRALHELSREGLVESIRGKGTVVRRVEVTDLHVGVSSWTGSIKAAGETPQTAWMKIDRPKPTSQTLNLLKLPPSAEVVRIRRLRMVRNQPICLLNNELPDELLPGLSKQHLDHESLYESLRHHFQLEPFQAEEEVTARASTARERKHLGKDCKIVLVVSRNTIMANGRPLELAAMIANANRYRYQVQLK